MNDRWEKISGPKLGYDTYPFSTHNQPPMLDRELVNMFLGTLQSPYLERMIRIFSSTFYDQVIVGELIESALKIVRIQGASSSQTSWKESFNDSQKEEEDETDAIREAPPLVPYGQYPYVAAIQCQQPQLPGPQYQQPWEAPHAN